MVTKFRAEQYRKPLNPCGELSSKRVLNFLDFFGKERREPIGPDREATSDCAKRRHRSDGASCESQHLRHPQWILAKPLIRSSLPFFFFLLLFLFWLWYFCLCVIRSRRWSFSSPTRWLSSWSSIFCSWSSILRDWEARGCQLTFFFFLTLHYLMI